MKQDLLKILHGSFSKESNLEQAVDANASDGTLDPEKNQQSVDFKAEIERLKNLQADTGVGDDTSSTTTPDDTNTAAPDDGGTQTDGTEPKPADTSGQGDDQNKSEPNDENEGGDETPEDIDVGDDPADTEDEDANTDAKEATEALSDALTLMRITRQAHETGVVKPIHAQLVLENLNNHARRYGFQVVTYAREADAPETSAGTTKTVTEQIKDFVKKLIAKIREFYEKVKAWLVEFWRSYASRHMVFDKNAEGYKKRLEWLDKQKIDDAKLQTASEKTTLLPNLIFKPVNSTETVGSKETTKAGILMLVSLISGVEKLTTEDKRIFEPFANLIKAGGNADLAILKSSEFVLTPHSTGLVKGSGSIFGTDKEIFDNLIETDNVVTVKNIIGNRAYVWTLGSEGAVDSMDDAYSTLMSYSFKISTTASDRKASDGGAEFKPLKTTADCGEVLAWIKILTTCQNNLIGRANELSQKSTKLSQMTAKGADDFKLGDNPAVEETKCLSLIGVVPQAYNQLALAGITQSARHLEIVINDLLKWVGFSVEQMASCVVKPA